MILFIYILSSVCAALSSADYRLKLAELDNKLEVVSKIRAYGRKYFVGDHKTDSISTFNMEEIAKAISKANDQAKELVLKQ